MKFLNSLSAPVKLLAGVALICVMAFMFMACTKDQVCDTAKTASGLVSAQVAVQLECKNVDAIREDIDALLVKLKVCEAPTGVTALGPIGEVICKPVIDALVAGLTTQIPAKYECSGGKLTDDIKAKLVAACAKAF